MIECSLNQPIIIQPIHNRIRNIEHAIPDIRPPKLRPLPSVDIHTCISQESTCDVTFGAEDSSNIGALSEKSVEHQ